MLKAAHGDIQRVDSCLNYFCRNKLGSAPLLDIIRMIKAQTDPVVRVKLLIDNFGHQGKELTF
jgi:hypothetical protein